MLLRELKDKGATVAWSPFTSQPSVVAAGTKEGGGGGFDDYGGSLEFTQLNFTGSDASEIASIKTTARFTSLAWGRTATCTDTPPLGIVAGGMADGVVNLWDAGKAMDGAGGDSLLSRVEGHEGAVRSVQFNPTPTSGHLYASGGSDSKVFVVNLQSPTSPTVAAPDVVGACAEGHPREITSVSWNSQVEHILATATQSGTCLVWDLRTNKPWCRLRDPGRSPFSDLAWNPNDGLYLVTATDDDVNPLLRLWDLRSNTTTPLAELRGHTKGILGVSWCPQDTGMLVSCGKDNRTLLWDMQTGKMLHDMSAADAVDAPAVGVGSGGLMGGTGGMAGGGGGLMDAAGGAQSLFGGSTPAFAGAGAGRRYEVHWSPCMPGLLASCSFDRTVAVHSLAAIPGEHASRAPKWMRRPVGASFGFGGKLVSFSNGPDHVTAQGHAVSRHIRVVPCGGDSSLAAASASLEEALGAGGDLAAYCEGKASAAADDKDKKLWSFMRILFDAQPRHKLLMHLGHSADDIKAEVGAYAAKHGVTLSTEAAAEPAAAAASPAGGAGTGAGGPAGSGTPPPAPLMPSESLITQPGDGTSAADVFGGPSASAADVFGGAPAAGGDNSGAGEESKKEAAGAPATPPVSTPPRASPVAAALASRFTPAPAPVVDAEGAALLRRSLLVGDFESAVKCCFAQNRLADALLLAACGAEDLWAATKEQYFKMTPSRFTRMVSAVTTSDLASLVAEQPLSDWRETLALLATFAKTDEFSALCEQLGDRLAADSEADGDRHAATLCYICAVNPTKTISSWVKDVAPRAAVVGFPLAVHEFVEKVTVFRQGVAQSDGAEVPAEDTQPEAGLFSTYCTLLASQGLLDVAHKYASTLRPFNPAAPSDMGAVEGEFLRARIHSAYGSDIRSLPLPVTPPEPSPAVTGVEPVPVPAAVPAASGADVAAGGYDYGTGQPAAAPAPAPAASTGTGYDPSTWAAHHAAHAAAPAPAAAYPAAAAPAAAATAAYGTAHGYTPATGGGAAGYYTPAPVPAPAPATAADAVPSATPRKAFSPDGFVSSAGNPDLGSKYGNRSAAVPAPAPAPAPAPPASVPISPATQTALDTFLALADHLATLDLTASEKRMLAEGKKAVPVLSNACTSGLVDDDTQGKLQQMAAFCSSYDFRSANLLRETLVNTHWNEHKAWLKNLKHLVQIGLKKYPQA